MGGYNVRIFVQSGNLLKELRHSIFSFRAIRCRDSRNLIISLKDSNLNLFVQYCSAGD